MSSTHPINRTTEWYDAQVKYGNYDPLPPEVKQEEISQKMQAVVAEFDPLAEKNLKQLKAMEDKIEEDTLMAYRRMRLEELKAKKARSKFGSVIEITKHEYVDEITNASKGGQYVLCLLYKEYIPECQILLKIWDQLARLHPETKFCRGVSDKVVPDFKDESLPAFLIYKDAKCVNQLVGLSLFGSPSTVTCDKIEWILARRLEIFETEQTSNPFTDGERRKRGRKGVISRLRMGGTAGDSEDESEYGQKRESPAESDAESEESAGEMHAGGRNKGYGDMTLDRLATEFGRR